MRRFEVPFRSDPLESFLTRLMFVALVLYCVPRRIPFTGQPDPSGLARLVDLTVLAHPAVLTPLWALLALACVAYASGRLVLPALTVILLTIVGTRTLTNSQGAINHTHQIVALTALGLLAGYLREARRRRAVAVEAPHPDFGPHDLAFHDARQAIVAAYLAAGISKLVKSGGTWLFDAPNLAVQILKTNDQHAYSFLGESAVGAMDHWAALIAGNPNLSRLFFGAGLFLELGAFFALAGRRAAIAVGSGLLVMQWVIAFLMKLNFLDNQACLLIFLVGVPGLLGQGVRAVRRWRPRAADGVHLHAS